MKAPRSPTASPTVLPSARPAAAGPTIESATLEAARRSRDVAAFRERLRRMVERPETAEALARAMRSWLRPDG
jgi:hypothetical protein